MSKDPHGSLLQFKAPKQQISLTSSSYIIFPETTKKNFFRTFLHQCRVWTPLSATILAGIFLVVSRKII